LKTNNKKSVIKQKQMTLLTFETIQSLNVRKVDTIDLDNHAQLDLYCYQTCSNDDSDALKHARGVIFDKTIRVSQGYPYTPEYTPETHPNFDLSKARVFESHEGTLLRVFYYHKWFISTHRRLDAYKSKWGCKKSFGALFQDALGGKKELDAFLDTLDKEKQYTFLLGSYGDNCIVSSQPKKPFVFYTGYFEKDSDVVHLDNSTSIPSPKELTFEDIHSLHEYVYSLNVRTLQGVIVYSHEDGIFKILHPDYVRLAALRGNESSINFRYLQLRMNNEVRDDYVSLYPEHIDAFNDYENILYTIAKRVKDVYIRRFIYKENATLPQEEYGIIKICHAWHCQDRSNNKVSLDKIIDTMNEQTPTRLNRMIRRILLEEREHESKFYEYTDKVDEYITDKAE